ncbi:MAG: hypothetical protein ABGZ17_14405, partial [Planctomycetaceae bacterium]
MSKTERTQSLLAIHVTEATPNESAGGSSHRFEVRPHESLSARLPPNFHLPFVIKSGDGDVQRVWPGGGPDRFLIECGLLGQVVLEASGKWGPQETQLSNLHRMVFQQRSNMRERRHREFNHHQDLLIAARGRDLPGEWNVLPFALRSSRPGSAISDLLEQGATEARAWGFTEPDFETRLFKGLLAAAKHSPIELDQMTPVQRSGMIRLLLFDAGQASGDTEFGRLVLQHRETVTQRLLDALEAHLEDDTDAFRKYFLEATSDLIRRISKQVRGGGPIPRAVVREIRLQLLIDAV